MAGIKSFCLMLVLFVNGVMATNVPFKRLMRALGDETAAGASVEGPEPTYSTFGQTITNEDLTKPIVSTFKDEVDESAAVNNLKKSLRELEWTSIAERAFKGDLLGAVRTSLLTSQNAQELSKAWSDPKIFKYIYENVPMMKAIKPLRAFGEKVADNVEHETGGFTAEDGVQAVRVYFNTFIKMLDFLEGMRDPEIMATKMYNLATNVDPIWHSLMARLDGGDRDAEVEMQQYLFQSELGDLMDLKEMGFDGAFPDFAYQIKEKTKDLEPSFFNLWEQEPMFMKYFDNPTLAMEEALEVTKFYEDYYSEHIEPGDLSVLSGA